MKKIIFSSLLCAAIFSMTSCSKEGDNSGNVSTENTISDAKGLVIVLEGVFPTNDTYQFFYSTDGSFAEDKSIKVPVIGQSVLQRVVVELPEGVKPQSFRLDYGYNANQTVVTIKKVEFNYLGNSFEILGADFYGKFFVDGQGTSYDPITLNINIKSNDDGTYDPYATSTDELKKNLNKLYNQSKEAK